MSNPPKFERHLLLMLLVIAQQHAPVALARALRRMGFVAGDVSFRRTKSRRQWASINRWPWEDRRACKDCGVTLHREAAEQGFETCSSCAYMRRSAR